MSALSLSYRPEIDGLRAIAVLSVIFYHAGFSFVSGGFVGVDIFFVISGFLITTIIKNNLDANQFSFADFYERRARRILPALFVVLFISILFAWFCLIPDEFLLFSRALIAVILFVSNTKLGQENNYFDPINELKPLTHMWSLAVEEQFYILFPVFLIGLWKFQRQRIVQIIFIILLLSLLGAEIGSVVKPGENFYFTLTRSWELLIGAASAFLIQKVQPNQKLQIIGIIFLAFPLVFFNSTTPTPSIYILFPTLGTALVIIYSRSEFILTRFLSNRISTFFGKISYSAYLWHYPIFSFYRIMFDIHISSDEAFLLIGLTFVLANFTWIYVEQPFRAGGKTIVVTQKSVFILSSIFSLLFLLFGFFGILSNGFEIRLNPEQRSNIIFQDDDSFKFSRSTSNKSCASLLNSPPLSEEVCIANSTSPKILIAGDSKAMSLYSAIYSKKFNVEAMLIAAHGCPLYPNLSYIPTFETGFSNNCTEIAKKVIDIATNLSSIEVIILFNEADNLNEDSSKYYLNGQKLNKVEAFNHAYSFVLSKLSKTGKNIIVVSDNPSWSVDPKKCIQKLPLSKAPSDSCRINVGTFKDGLPGYYRALEELKKTHSNVVIYDPTRVLCDKNGSCDVREDHKLLYFDQTHMSPFAALKVLNAISNDGYLQY